LPVFVGLDIRFISPVEGQKVTAGDSVDVILKIDTGHELEMIMVAFSGGGLMMEPPFRQKLAIPRNKIGTMSFMAIGTTAAKEMISSRSVNIEVGVGEAELTAIALFDETPRLTGPGDVRSMIVYGEYSDGVRRDITDYKTLYSIAEGSEAACVTHDGIIVGRTAGTASILVKHGGVEKIIRVNVGDRPQQNNPPQPVLQEMYEGAAGKRLCVSALDSRDHDACRGEPLTEESFQWRVDFDSTSIEGAGSEFCFTPDKAGMGMLMLVVTDKYGASSETFAMVVIE
jgi:hypothetical protein